MQLLTPRRMSSPERHCVGILNALSPPLHRRACGLASPAGRRTPAAADRQDGPRSEVR